MVPSDKKQPLLIGIPSEYCKWKDVLGERCYLTHIFVSDLDPMALAGNLFLCRFIWVLWLEFQYIVG